MPVTLKYQSDLPSLCIKTAPLQKVLWGSQWMDKYFATVLNLIQFIPIFNLEIPLCTARTPQNGYAWQFSPYFQLLQRLTYWKKERISSTSCHLGRWAPRTALQTILTCALHNMLLAMPVLLRAQKEKVETKQKNAQTLPIALVTYPSLSLLFWTWVSWTGAQKHYPDKSIYCILWKSNHAWKKPPTF